MPGIPGPRLLFSRICLVDTAGQLEDVHGVKVPSQARQKTVPEESPETEKRASGERNRGDDPDVRMLLGQAPRPGFVDAPAGSLLHAHHLINLDGGQLVSPQRTLVVVVKWGFGKPWHEKEIVFGTGLRAHQRGRAPPVVLDLL